MRYYKICLRLHDESMHACMQTVEWIPVVCVVVVTRQPIYMSFHVLRASMWASMWASITCFLFIGNLTGVNMQRMLMYPPSGGYWPFLPAAFMLPPANASLIMTGCSITTLCSTLQAYVNWMNVTSPESITVRYDQNVTCFQSSPCIPSSTIFFIICGAEEGFNDFVFIIDRVYVCS